MIRIFKLVVLLVISQVAFGQAPSNYTNINGRYRWIAGMFDSTFHIPKGSTPSLRTGGSTNSGGLFYNTSDSSVYTYTGTQWIKLRGSINPSDTTNKYVTQVYKKNASDSVFYVKGGNHIWAFNDSTGSPGGGGGGKVYYFNGGVNMGTISGLQMYELGDTANTGAAANFTRSTTGNIANFITDPGKPGLLQIPAGVWSVDAWLSETGGGANHAEIWIEVEKWDGSTITTIATSPIEQITEGATPNLYSWSVSIPTTSLTVTDRIIIQFYISNTNGKTVTLYTQNGYVGEVHTTFTTGIGAINGLTAPAQYLVTGTSGTDFNINSTTATHTFNLPTASATNRGALSTTDWSTFNNKIGGTLVSGYLTKATGTNTIDTSQIYQSNGRIGVSTVTPQTRLMVAETASDGALSILGNPSNVATFKFYANDGSTIQSVVNSSASAMQIGTFVNSEMNLITNSATRVSILNNGNVGIGSGASTDSMLTVENGARFKRGVRMSGLPTAPGTKALRINASGTISIADTLIDAGGTVTSVATNTGTGITGGTITTSGTIAADTLLLSTRAWRQKGVDSVASLINTRISGTTNYIPKFTSSSAIGNSVIYEASGDIGVGTTSPDVFNRFYSGTILGVSGSGQSSIGINAASGSASYFDMGVNGTRSFSIYADASIADISTIGALPLTFGINSSEQMRLTSTGLGIGTSSPAYKLQVLNAANGFLARFTGGASSDVNIGIYATSSPAGGSIGTESNHPFNIFTNGTDRVSVTAAGNVGIGTTSPTRLLDVNGVIRTQNAGSAGAPSIELGTSAQGNGLFYPTTNTIAISTNDTERMRITSGGDVAINTTTANSKLHVAGSLRLPLVTKSATYTLDATDYTVGFDCTGANRTANLPDATTCSGRIYVIYQFGGGSTYGVTIDGNSSQTINGSATYVLQGYCDYSSVMIQSDGSNWVVISDALQTGCL